MDAVLVALRAVLETHANGLIAHGEGAIVVMAALSEAIRTQAYKDRRVPNHEATKLEECATSLSHVLLLAPHVYPFRSYMPFLQVYVPEITCIIPGATEVLALIHERDSSASPSKEAAQAIMGVIIEYVRFPGPAYRTIPKPPLPLYQLVPEAKAKLPLITSSDGNPPTRCVELWAGCAILTKEWVRLGFVGKPYECQRQGQYRPDGDLSRP